MTNNLQNDCGRKHRPLLMAVVRLPKSDTITMTTLLICAGISRQTLKMWRDRRSFPPTMLDGSKGWFVTAQVADWFASQGVEVVSKNDR